MHVQTSDAIRQFHFDSFPQTDLIQAVFARHGGVSEGAFASLNMSVSVGDSLENVRANRARAFLAAGRDPDSVADLWQVHSADVVVADEPRGPREHLGQADALITNQPHVTLFLRFADCVPILLFDPKRRAIGIVHAGWRGTLLKAVAAAVQAMTERYGSDPRDVLAGIGPSIGPCHYAIGPEVVAQTRTAFNSHSDEMLRPMNGQMHLDLWAANAHTLRESGVEQIEVSAVCTACHTDDFFSHRGEHGQTGRFGALIALH